MLKLKLLLCFLVSTCLSYRINLNAQNVTGKDLGVNTSVETRRSEQCEVKQSERIMDVLGIKPGWIIGEVGSGEGRMTIHLANRVGEKGKVYASDLDSEIVKGLENKFQQQGLINIEPVVGFYDKEYFPENSLDIVIISESNNRIAYPVSFFNNLKACLKPWGSVVLIEPKSLTLNGVDITLTRVKANDFAKSVGYSLDIVIEDCLESANIFVMRPLVYDTPESHDAQKIRSLWLNYLEWIKSSQSSSSLRDYAKNLEAKGVPVKEIRRQLKVIRSQYTEQPEGIELLYDPIYGKPLTGDMGKDGFQILPNKFLIEAMKTIPLRGQALDVGTGMGRNAIYLASLGWDVTGIDLSSKGLEVMQDNAKKAGLNVHSVKTSYDDFDFESTRWDLIVLILSWAPIEENDFLIRLKNSLRPNGYIVFEHVIQSSSDPFPPGVHALSSGQLKELFSDFEILIYREIEDYGDWGGPPTALVRMVARKKS